MIPLEMSAMSAFLKAREIMRERRLESFTEATDIALNSFTESSRHDYVEALKINEILEEDLDASIWESALRIILKVAILRGNYPWKGSFKFGRKYVLDALSVNERQVFRSAGLLDNEFSEEAVNWWDQMQNSIGNSDFDMDFRKWEQKTFDQEVRLLKELGSLEFPKWEAIDDNLSGYDILSYRQIEGKWEEIYIEVKSSSTGLRRFYLSDREAEKLEKVPNCYFIHFWNTKKEEQVIISGEEVIKHLPKNQGLGHWKTVLIDL